MVAIMIFFFGLVSVYSVVSSTLRVNQYNKNYIIASHLASEQLEIVKNLRDYNFKKIRPWNAINSDGSDTLWTWNYYTIENKPGSFLDMKITAIEEFQVWIEFLESRMLDYRLCLDSEWIYSYSCVGNSKTAFYRYSYIDEVFYNDEDGERVVIEDALKIQSVVVWYQAGYHQTQISTILTDWQRL